MNAKYRNKVTKMLDDFRSLNDKIEALQGNHDSRLVQQVESMIHNFESSALDLGAASKSIVNDFKN